MPSVSKRQHRLMEVALAYKRGKNPNASPEAQKVADGMTEEQITHFTSTPDAGLPEKKAAGPKLGAGILFLNSDGSYMLEKNHPEEGEDPEKLNKLRPAGGGKSKRDGTLRDTALRELREEFGLEPEFSDSHLWLAGFIKDGDYKDCAMFIMVDHGLTAKKYQASNSVNEYVNLVKGELHDRDYIGKKPSELRGPETPQEWECAGRVHDTRAVGGPIMRWLTKWECGHSDTNVAICEKLTRYKAGPCFPCSKGFNKKAEESPEEEMKRDRASAEALAAVEKTPLHQKGDTISADGKPLATESSKPERWHNALHGLIEKVVAPAEKKAAAVAVAPADPIPVPLAQPAPVKSVVPLTGPEAIFHALSRLDVDRLQQEQMDIVHKKQISKRPRAVHILNTLEGLKRNNLKPSDLMISRVPVIPPVFRPFSVVGETFVPGDANELYRDLFNQKRVYNEVRDVLGEGGAADAKLALYDSIKALYGYGDPVSVKTKARGVSGFLKQITGATPKFGFFQYKLIGKPQDSVSRGAIVVDPELSLDQIGIPKEMAWPMYSPYIQRRLTMSGMSPKTALQHLKERSPFAERALHQEIEHRPVIYSRAPSWHKFNVLAGHAKLINGDAIAINPLVTTGANADFDGDTMNIHVPAQEDSVTEAKEKLLPSKMLWSIRDQDKVMPTLKHEQILGLYAANRRSAKAKHVFASEADALHAIKTGKVSLQDEVEIGTKPTFAHS